MDASLAKERYAQAWRDCALANHWHESQELTDEALDLAAARSPDHAAVVAKAEAIALLNQRPITAEDLRRACHLRAGDRGLSPEPADRANAEQVLALFRFLRHPDDPAAIRSWLEPDDVARRRLVRLLKLEFQADYVAIVARRKFGALDWRDLSTPYLEELRATLQTRELAKRAA